MYETTRSGLEEAQEQAKDATRQIVDTNRSALRSYLRAAFQLQRAGLDAIEALQRGSEALAFSVVDRAEEAQDKALTTAELRIRESAERLREMRTRARANAERLQTRFREEQGDLEEAGERTESRLREGAEVALKVAKVVETRVETMLSELLDMGRRELSEVQERLDALVDRLDAELEEEIHPVANYDDKTVEEVIAELDGLDGMQLRIIRAYEVRHKNRVTILRAIDERLAREDELGEAVQRVQAAGARVEERVEESFSNPIANYDEKNVEEVAEALERLDATELAMVRAYELAHKNRVTVLRAIDERLADKAEQAAS